MNHSVWPASISKRTEDVARCEACGERFACGAKFAQCWCSEIKLDRSAREDLRERFQGCLCRACLERIARDEIDAAPETAPREL